jgi:hypothetical protein
VDRAGVARSGAIRNLESDTDYVVWVTAEDNVAQPNRMSTFETVPFSTPDIVPPTLAASIDTVRGESFDLLLELDEAGSARCVAVLAGSSSPLSASGVPSAQQILDTPPAALFPDGLAGSVDASFTSSNLQVTRRVGSSTPLLEAMLSQLHVPVILMHMSHSWPGCRPYQMAPVASETEFDVYCGARDLQGNFDEPPTELSVTTLDVTPPVFVDDTPRQRSVRETSFGVVVQLNEPGRVSRHPFLPLVPHFLFV